MRNIRKELFTFAVTLCMISSMLAPVIVLAGQSSYTYDTGHVMTYDLVALQQLNVAGAGGYTNTENDAIAFIGIFAYNKNGEALKADTKKQDFYAYITVTATGAKRFKSAHSLLYADSRPIGTSKSLEIQ